MSARAVYHTYSVGGAVRGLRSALALGTKIMSLIIHCPGGWNDLVQYLRQRLAPADVPVSPPGNVCGDLNVEWVRLRLRKRQTGSSGYESATGWPRGYNPGVGSGSTCRSALPHDVTVKLSGKKTETLATEKTIVS